MLRVILGNALSILKVESFWDIWETKMAECTDDQYWNIYSYSQDSLRLLEGQATSIKLSKTILVKGVEDGVLGPAAGKGKTNLASRNYITH